MIGKIIKEIRRNVNMTQDEMAQALYVTRQAVSRWENNETTPNIETLKQISKMFGVSLNRLLATAQSTDDPTAEINADRFIGFADVYENSRPTVPAHAIEIITDYLGKTPDTVVDMGCGTGLSTRAWEDKCGKVIGIEPSGDMLQIAKAKSGRNASFVKAYSDNTGLPDDSADVVFCSQSFHWMNPQDTLLEIDRILKKDGIFAAVDCDWPPVCNADAEIAYMNLFNKVRVIEDENEDIRETFHRWDKNKHLQNMLDSGYFKYCREVVFDNSEECDIERFLALAQSQGGLQTILKRSPELIENDYLNFRKAVCRSFGKGVNKVSFCYRMRIGIK